MSQLFARMSRALPRGGSGRRLSLLFATALASMWASLALTPALASAASDPTQVNFTLEGCRLPAGETLPNASGDFVCNDADYTTGNLGKSWNELDLVPHRLTTSTNTAQTFTVAITADNMNGGNPGYDVISVPVLNTRLSSGTCAVSAGPQSTLTPGAGGTDTSIYRLLTITQSSGSTCVFDYYERLALGSAQFSGSSLHSNLLNQAFGTAGVGARDVSIPVKEILPQTLSKTMTATTGNTTSWNVTKDSSPSSLTFDTCASGTSAQAQGVTITVNWTRTTVSATSVTIVTNITFGNPASRDITASVSDKTYAGTTQTTQVGTTYVSGNTLIPRNSTKTVTNTQTVPVTAGVSSYNDVATATYTDLVTGVPVPGNTTATASANVVSVPTADNSTATISDTERISGTGLTFSINSISDAGGTLSPSYTVGSGSRITGPITWSKAVTGSGSAVFQKTVYVDGQRNTTGSLSDTATLTDKVGNVMTAAASTTITARACIQGQKFVDRNANGVKDAGEPGLAGVRVYVDLNNDSVFDPIKEPSAVTAADGTYSISTASIPDGTYTLREVLPAGQVCSFPATCSYSIVVGPGGPIVGRDFGNYVPATVSGHKYGDVNGNGVQDGGETGLAGFRFYVDVNGNSAFDQGEPSAVSAADGTFVITGIKPGASTVREVGQTGYTCTQPSPCSYTVTLTSGSTSADKTFGNFKVPPPPPPPPVVSPVVVVSPPPAPPVVKPEQVVSGTAALRGPKRCVTRPFVAAVRGRSIARVQFYLDNRLVATRTKRDKIGAFSLRVDPGTLSYARHRIMARVQFTSASQTPVKKPSFSFARCARAKVIPFTG